MYFCFNGFMLKLLIRKLFYDCEVLVFLIEFVEEEILGRFYFIFFLWSGIGVVISFVREVRD